MINPTDILDPFLTPADFGHRIHYDTQVFVSIPSRNGFIASHNFVDEVLRKLICVLVKTIDADSYVTAIKHVRKVLHKRHGLVWKVIHSDNVSLFSDFTVKEWL